MFTALLIAVLIIAGATTVVGGGLVWQHQRRRALERAGSEPKLLGSGSGGSRVIERGPRQMRPGDIIQHDGRDWLVEGVVHYDEDGHRWLAGRLVDVKETRWLVAGMDRAGQGALLLLEPDPSIEVGSYPPEAIAAGERRYLLERRGTATVRIEGDAGGLPAAPPGGPPTVLRCRWWRYAAAGDARILVEQWGQDFRTLRGAELGAGAVELMPGS
ncbi:MAG TPA: DUF4178 domain-containing protein [Kofleriaceae bacterium]|nr:DUF4178 domain-containing protein [Kofleriaceae bacterium]